MPTSRLCVRIGIQCNDQRICILYKCVYQQSRDIPFSLSVDNGTLKGGVTKYTMGAFI